jgi:hypothetical protein
VSDHALSFLGKRCPNLRKLMLMCCPNVSDKGLGQMVRKIHLSALHISHNLLITDAGIEKLISASSQLTSIELQNCPNITDRSVEAMYEGITAWGKRRNTKSATLRTLVRILLYHCSSFVFLLLMMSLCVSLVHLLLPACIL